MEVDVSSQPAQRSSACLKRFDVSLYPKCGSTIWKSGAGRKNSVSMHGIRRRIPVGTSEFRRTCSARSTVGMARRFLGTSSRAVDGTCRCMWILPAGGRFTSCATKVKCTCSWDMGPVMSSSSPQRSTWISTSEKTTRADNCPRGFYFYSTPVIFPTSAASSFACSAIEPSVRCVIFLPVLAPCLFSICSLIQRSRE